MAGDSTGRDEAKAHITSLSPSYAGLLKVYLSESVPAPESITLALRLRDGKSRWMQGEAIKLELEFSSSQPRAYIFNNAVYDSERTPRHR